MRSEFYERLRKRLYEYDEIEVLFGFNEGEHRNPDIDEKLRLTSEELRIHSEQFTVRLMQRFFATLGEVPILD